MSLMLSSGWSCRNVAAHKYTIISTCFRFKQFCALHKTREIAARRHDRRIAARPAAVGHASLLPFGAGSAAKQWRYPKEASPRSDQYRRKRFVSLTAFQLFFTLIGDE
jgi:hypothetical protein